MYTHTNELHYFICVFLQLNTDIETHVRSMSTRRRIPSKSTEDVGDSHSSRVMFFMHLSYLSPVSVSGC